MDAPTFAEIRADLKQHLTRAKKAKFLEARPEFAENVYPLLNDLVEALDDRLLLIEGSLAEVIAQTESLVQPELADQIDETLGLADKLLAAVSAHFTEAHEGKMSEELATLCAQLKQSIEMTGEAVSAVAAPDDGEEGEAEDEANEGEGSDVEAPAPPAAASAEGAE